MAKAKKDSSKLIVGLVFAAILALVVGIALYQANTNKSLTELRARAADPCNAYPKLTAVTTGTGTVHNEQIDRFNWWENGNSAKAKVVVICSGAKFVRQFGGAITYAEVGEGDKVVIVGNYGDTTKTTILATGVTDMSTSVAREYKATVASVNPSESSFTLNAVTMVIAGKYGPYTLTVKWAPLSTKCYFQTKNTPLKCSNLAVGNRVVVSGILYDPTLTINAETIIMSY